MGDIKANNLCYPISTLFTTIGAVNSSMEAGHTGTCARDPAYPTNASVAMPWCTCAITHARHVGACASGVEQFWRHNASGFRWCHRPPCTARPSRLSELRECINVADKKAINLHDHISVLFIATVNRV